MNYKADKDANISGTSLQAYVSCSFDQLVKLFGDPEDNGDEKVCFEWTITDDNGEAYTIYDYKMTRLYSGDESDPEPWELQRVEDVEWHIGATSEEKGKAFAKWVVDKLDEDPDEWVDVIVDVQSLRVRMPKRLVEAKDEKEIEAYTATQLRYNMTRNQTLVENYQLEEELG